MLAFKWSEKWIHPQWSFSSLEYFIVSYQREQWDLNEYDQNGDTVLIAAIQEGENEVLRYITDPFVASAKLDVNKPQVNGAHPLMCAMKRKNYYAAHLLIEKGADVWKEERGLTLLFHAFENMNGHLGSLSSFDFVELFLTQCDDYEKIIGHGLSVLGMAHAIKQNQELFSLYDSQAAINFVNRLSGQYQSNLIQQELNQSTPSVDFSSKVFRI